MSAENEQAGVSEERIGSANLFAFVFGPLRFHPGGPRSTPLGVSESDNVEQVDFETSAAASRRREDDQEHLVGNSYSKMVKYVSFGTIDSRGPIANWPTCLTSSDSPLSTILLPHQPDESSKTMVMEGGRKG